MWKTAQDAYYSSGGGWGQLSNPERFAHMSFFLTWRMNHTSIGILDFVTYSEREGGSLGRHLAASFALHADLDPEMSAFLVEFLGQVDLSFSKARTSSAGSKGRQALLRWGDHIFWAFQPRIHAFRDAICRRWDPSVDPFALEPEWPVVRRGAKPRRWSTPRYPDISVALTPEALPCSLELAGTGWNDLDDNIAIGMVCYAMWRQGAPYETMNQFVVEAEAAHKNMPEVISRWVDLDGTRGASAFLATLREILYPRHPLHSLLQMEKAGLEHVELVFVRTVKDAEAIGSALRSRGWTIIMMIDCSPLFPDDPPSHVIAGLTEVSISPAIKDQRRVMFDMSLSLAMRTNTDCIVLDGSRDLIGENMSWLRTALMIGQFVVLVGADDATRQDVLAMVDELRGDSQGGYPRVVDASDRMIG